MWCSKQQSKPKTRSSRNMIADNNNISISTDPLTPPLLLKNSACGCETRYIKCARLPLFYSKIDQPLLKLRKKSM